MHIITEFFSSFKLLQPYSPQVQDWVVQTANSVFEFCWIFIYVYVTQKGIGQKSKQVVCISGLNVNNLINYMQTAYLSHNHTIYHLCMLNVFGTYYVNIYILLFQKNAITWKSETWG